jgi:hypothetical protein
MIVTIIILLLSIGLAVALILYGLFEIIDINKRSGPSGPSPLGPVPTPSPPPDSTPPASLTTFTNKRIKSRVNNKCIVSDGSKILLRDCSNNDIKQKFTLTNLGQFIDYQGKCLVNNRPEFSLRGRTTDTSITNCSDNISQKWRLNSLTENFYSINSEKECKISTSDPSIYYPCLKNGTNSIDIFIQHCDTNNFDRHYYLE